MTSLPVLAELRDGYGCQNPDDRDNDHQFNQGKTFLVPSYLPFQA
jgi:hypothetical protein